MRPLLLLLLIAAISVAAPAQSQVEPQVRSEPQPREVTLADLEGHTIRSTNSFTARFRSARGEASGGFTMRREFKMLANAVVEAKGTRDAWWDTPGGRMTGRRQTAGTGTIGQPMERKDGSGTGIFVFEANTLTWLSVFETGGTTLKITFEKGDAGLMCSAVAAMAQEVGAGPTKAPPNVEGGGKVQVLSSRPTSSRCTVQPTEHVEANDGFWAAPKSASPRSVAPRVAGSCTRCLTRCGACGASEGSRCFQLCQGYGNPMVRSDSVCGKFFVPCGR